MPSRGDVSDYDVVVIGAGPAGAAAAELAGILGYSVALAERDVVGGTVVTSGGAPTKTFREAATYLSAFEKEKVYGIAPVRASGGDVSGHQDPGPRGQRAAPAGHAETT